MAHQEKIVEIENFIDSICEYHKIFDIQYGNILATNTLIFEMICDISNNKQQFINFVFESKNKSLSFKIDLGDSFIDVMKYIETAKTHNLNTYQAEDNGIRMNIVKNLTDRIYTDADNNLIELVFYVTGVNEMLTDQRIEMLGKYFNIIGAEVSQQQ